jgi:hypothetical protein
MTFPGAGAQVYYNTEGEPLGWDYPGYDDGPDPDDFYDAMDDYDDEPDGEENEVCDRCGAEFPPERFREAAEHVKTCTAAPLYSDEDENDDLPF